MLSRFLTRREQFVVGALAAALLLGSVAIFFSRTVPASSAKDAEPVLDREAPAPAPEPAPAPQPVALQPLEPPSPPSPAEPPAVAVAPPDPEPVRPRLLTVAVEGAVMQPGLYTFPEGARVRDALARAGGVAPGADMRDINRAAELIDGTTLAIPATPTGGMRDGRLVLKATQPVSVPNPPEYTISGWRARSARAVPAESPAAVGATVDAMPARTAAPPAESNPDAIDLNTATEDELASLPGIGPKLASEIARYRSHSPFTRVDDVMNVSGIGPKRLDAMRPFVTVK